MKLKCLFIAISILCCFNLNCQTKPDNFTFKDIPITGSLENMITRLKRQGYSLESQTNSTALLSGIFANEDCGICVYTTKKTKTVYSILVVFEEETSWYSLKSAYKKFKNQLTQKYKIAPDVTEEFVDPYYEGDGYEMQALRNRKCFYWSHFNFDNGTIKLVILDDRIALQYLDKKGNQINEKEENQSTMDDL